MRAAAALAPLAMTAAVLVAVPLATVPTPACAQAAGGGGGATSTGSVGCTALVQAAANGTNARVGADDTRINQPQSVVNLSCLDNFFNGVGLNLVTNLLNPTTLLQQVQGRICSMVQNAWTSALGQVQCGITLTGFNIGFMGGFGGGLSCPRLSFGGGGPPIGSIGLGVGNGGSGGGIYIGGNGLVPTGYTNNGIRPGTF